MGFTSPSSRAEPGTGTSFAAEANWFIPKNRPHRYTWYGAIAWGGSELSGGYPASIVKGYCRVARKGDGIGCVGFVLARTQKEDVFEMDPVMQTAKLSMEDDEGRPLTVTWSAKATPPWTGSMEEVCATGAASEYYVERDASAVANLAEEELSEPAPINGRDLTYLSRGAGVDSCVTETRFGSGGRVERFFRFE